MCKDLYGKHEENVYNKTCVKHNKEAIEKANNDAIERTKRLYDDLVSHGYKEIEALEIIFRAINASKCSVEGK